MGTIDIWRVGPTARLKITDAGGRSTRAGENIVQVIGCDRVTGSDACIHNGFDSFLFELFLLSSHEISIQRVAPFRHISNSNTRFLR